MTNTMVAPKAGVSKASVVDPAAPPAHRVVLIDPREERRALMSMVVDRCPSLMVVGVAAGLNDAEQQIRTERADVALVEIQMPAAEGLVTIAALRQQFPDLRIVVCSFQKDSVTREAAKARGADGYLVKPLHVEDLLALVLAPPPPTVAV